MLLNSGFYMEYILYATLLDCLLECLWTCIYEMYWLNSVEI